MTPGNNGASTPFTSETEIETETDDALTFSPKRRSPRSSFSSTRDRIIGHERSRSRTQHLDKRANGQGSSPTDEEMRHLEPAGAGAHHPASLPFDLLHGADGTVPLAVANGLAAGQTSAATPPTPPAASKPPAKAGQTISESELMRRRRLLDSHLISNSDSPSRAATPS